MDTIKYFKNLIVVAQRTNGQEFINVMEVLGLVVPAVQFVTIVNHITTGFLTKDDHLKRFILDYLIITVPIILTTTILEGHLILFNTVLAFISISLYFAAKKTVTFISSANDLFQDHQREERSSCITNYRSCTNIITAVAILGIDFNVFPDHYGKRSKYGFSLMDTGVGLFILANGMVVPVSRASKNINYKTFLGTIPLFVIGYLRYLLTHNMHYDVSVLEYGVHWNFFITLGVTKLISSFILYFIKLKSKTCLIIGLVLIALHQSFLQLGLRNFVFSNTARTTFIQANREGIGATLGYVGLFFISVHIGFVLTDKNKGAFTLFKDIIKYVSIYTVLTIVCFMFLDVSRCLANATYCFWIMTLGLFITSLFFLMDKLFYIYYYKSKNIMTVPFVFEAINYNGLTYFLIANLLTGVANIVLDTKHTPNSTSMLILCIYMLITTGIIAIMYTKKILIKL